MSKAYIDESSLTSIGNAIRSVNGSSSLYTPSQMASEILTLTSGGLTYKGTVSSQSQLPSSPSDGDLYIVGNQTMFWSDADDEWKTISVQSTGGVSTVKVNGTALVEDSQGAVDVVIPSWAMQQSKPSYTASEVGAVATSSVGTSNGVASLGSDGKVPSSQLPEQSQVDFATQSEAETGTDNTKAMTPLRVAQEIAAKTDTYFSSSSSNPVKNYVIKQQLEQRFLSRSVASVERSTAISSHGVDDYIVVEGLLYKVTSAISIGDTIDNSNTQLADLSDMISDILDSEQSSAPTPDWSVTVSSQDGYIANKPFQSLSPTQFTQVVNQLRINTGALVDSGGGIGVTNDKMYLAVDGSSVIIDQNGQLKATGVPTVISPLEVNSNGNIIIDLEELMSDITGNGLNSNSNGMYVEPSDFVDQSTIVADSNNTISVDVYAIVDNSTIDIDANGMLSVKLSGIADGSTIAGNSSGYLEVKLNQDTMEYSNGIGVKIANGSIGVDSGNGIYVDLSGIIWGNALGTDGSKLYLNYNDSLDEDSDGLYVKTDGTTIKTNGGLYVDTEEICDGSTIYAHSDSGQLAVLLSGGLDVGENGGIKVKTEDEYYSSFEGGLGIDSNTDCLYVRKDMFLPCSSVAPVEGSTASSAYSVGEYLMQQGVLKRVTSAISSGDTIADGTNVTTTTIMEEIARLTQ